MLSMHSLGDLVMIQLLCRKSIVNTAVRFTFLLIVFVLLVVIFYWRLAGIEFWVFVACIGINLILCSVGFSVELYRKIKYSREISLRISRWGASDTNHQIEN